MAGTSEERQSEPPRADAEKGGTTSQVQGSFPGVPSTRLLTTRELAEHLAVTESAVKKWVWLRRIPAIHIGRCIRFNLEEVLAHFRCGETAQETSSSAMLKR